MNVTAVIAEYNPFHNGHLYQLDTIRQTQDADIILIVLSGNFMQRGIPAILDKYERCRMALENGADLVFELPVYFALGSAEYFAQGAVSLIDKLGVVDTLHFGSESGDSSLLYELTDGMLARESGAYKTALNHYLKKGLSFPAARDSALCELLPGQDVKSLVSAPNNILGIEYIKALIQRDSTIKPVTVTRKGEGYASDSLAAGSFASANGIRKALFQPVDADSLCSGYAGANHRSAHNAHPSACIENHVPPSVYARLRSNQFLCTDDFSEMLLYKLLQDKNHAAHPHKDAFAAYYDIGPQLSHTLYNNLPQYTDFDGFAQLCKTRNLTYTRICRGLMHILLDMTQENAEALKNRDYAQYARLLGFTARGMELLKTIKANASIPVITKPASALRQLAGAAQMSLRADIHAADIYHSVLQQKHLRMSKPPANAVRQNELTCQVIKLS